MRVVLVAVPRVLLLVLAAVAMAAAGARTTLPLPDLVLPVVVASALLAGPTRGALWGLAGGWVVDLVPPGSAVLGTSALAYAACGLLAGLGRREGPAAWGWLALVGGGCAVVVGAGHLVVAVATRTTLDPGTAGWHTVSSVAWCAAVAPLLVAAEHAWARR